MKVSHPAYQTSVCLVQSSDDDETDQRKVGIDGWCPHPRCETHIDGESRITISPTSSKSSLKSEVIELVENGNDGRRLRGERISAYQAKIFTGQRQQG